MEEIKVVIVMPNKRAYIKNIEHTLENMQTIVGGYIESVFPFNDNVAIICNEEGKLNGMEPNRAFYDKNRYTVDILYGPFFVCGVDKRGEMISLTDKQAEMYREKFEMPESFSQEVRNYFF